MNSRREQVWVGIFVMIAAVVLIGVVLSVSGAFAKKGSDHRAYFKFASGTRAWRAGSIWRASGRQGRETSRGPADSTRIEIEFRDIRTSR